MCLSSYRKLKFEGRPNETFLYNIYEKCSSEVLNCIVMNKDMIFISIFIIFRIQI